ncbi:hypothetical protein ScPMuIL_009048 [Solemya velum]
MGKYLVAVVVLGVVLLNGFCICQVKFDKKEVVNRNDSKTFSNCNDARDAGYNKSGIYRLHMLRAPSNISTKPTFHIYCKFTANNAFNVIQRRLDGTLNFNTFYHYYVNGFGHPTAEYWAGLNPIQYLTQTGSNRLQITLQEWNGNTVIVRYSHFSLSGSTYRLNIYGYVGSIADDMSFANGQDFHTSDYPDARNCAVNQKAGWWYNNCAYALLNGFYYRGGPYTPSGTFYDGIYWKDWLGYGYSLKYTEMAVY